MPRRNEKEKRSLWRKISLKISSQWTRMQRSESSVAGQELDATERRWGKGPRRKNLDSGQSRAERKRQEEPGMASTWQEELNRSLALCIGVTRGRQLRGHFLSEPQLSFPWNGLIRETFILPTKPSSEQTDDNSVNVSFVPSTRDTYCHSHFTDEETGPCDATCPGSRSLQGPGNFKPLFSVTTQAASQCWFFRYCSLGPLSKEGCSAQRSSL